MANMNLPGVRRIEALIDVLKQKVQPNRITVGLHVKSTASLGPSAYDIAEFVNILREQTDSDYVIDVQAAVNMQTDSAGEGGLLPPVVGFTTGGSDGHDDDDEDDPDMKAVLQ